MHLDVVPGNRIFDKFVIQRERAKGGRMIWARQAPSFQAGLQCGSTPEPGRVQPDPPAVCAVAKCCGGSCTFSHQTEPSHESIG